MGQIINRQDINSHLHGYCKVVSTNGCFDILTVGHKRLLEYARSLGDVLIVAINSDASTRRIKGPGRPLIPQDERAELIAAFGFVGYVVIFHERTAEKVLDEIKPAIHVKGNELAVGDIVEHDVVEGNGGRIELFPIIAGMSSSHTLSRLPASDRVHAGFTLVDTLNRERVGADIASQMGIVLSADARMLKHDATIAGGKPVVIERDVTNRWLPCMKVATG